MRTKLYFWRYIKGKYDALKERELKEKLYFKHSLRARELLEANDSENAVLKSLILSAENVIMSYPKEKEAELTDFTLKLLLAISDAKKQTKANLELYEELEEL